MRIAEPCASNFSLRMVHACKLQLCIAVLNDVTCLTSGEEESTVTHRGGVTPGKRNTKPFILLKFNP